MKTIGLIGGMSWQSTIPYYREINCVVAKQLGGLHSAKLLLHSVDFHDVEKLQRADHWHEAGELLSEAAQGLETAGADFLVLCTNTMHKVAEQLESSVSIPLLHIADTTASAIKAAGLERVGLIGTRFTMEQDFYRQRLEDRHGLQLLVPCRADRADVHAIIYDELCRGRIHDSSRSTYRRVVEDLVDRGCQGIILGCTEIGLLLTPGDVQIPLFDTAAIHAEMAALHALDD